MPDQPSAPAPVPTPPPAALAAHDADRLCLQWVLESNEYAVVLLSPQGTILAWRGAAQKVFGYTEQEVLGQPIALIFSDRDRCFELPALEREIAATGARAEDDRWHVRKDGTRIWVTGSVQALRDDAGRLLAYAKVMRDRTDLRSHIETLEQRIGAMTDAAHDKDVFFARLMHEMRNALAPMGNAAELIRRAAQPSQLEFPLAIVRRQLELLTRMVGDLFQVARAGVEQLQLQPERFELGAELGLLCEGARPRAEQKRLQLHVLLPHAPLEIEADRTRVVQALFNLLDNALKYTPAGGTIWVKCVVEGDDVVVRVQDTGQGIEPALLPRIFELFTRECPHDGTGGLGVGLGLVKELVQAHGGTVEVRSEGHGRGSEFTVRLPRTAPAD